MTRTSLFAGCVVVAVALVAVGVAAGTGPTVAADTDPEPAVGETPTRIVDNSNTSNYLFPSTDDPTRQEYVHADVDVGSAVAVSAHRLEGTHRERTYVNRLEYPGVRSSERLAIVRRAIEGSETRLERLDETHEALVRGYNNGTLTRAEFLRGLVKVEVQATQSRQYLDRVRTTSEAQLGTMPTSLDTRLSELRSQLVLLPDPLVLLPDPLNDRMRAAVTGREDPLVVYAGGADDELVLATVDGTDFRRQTTLRSEHRPADPDQFEQSDEQAITLVVQRATELYPWAYSDGQQFSPQIGRAGPKLYRIDADHPHGALAAYISGSTTNVFHEIHRQNPQALPVYETIGNETDSLNATVTTTTETGPMRVRLTDSQSDQPRNATVYVNDQSVGTTGSDGTLWTVRPMGTFQLTVVDESGERVTFSRVKFIRPDAGSAAG